MKYKNYKDYIGKTYISKQYGEFTVIERDHVDKTSNSMMTIEFKVTGSRCAAQIANIRIGNVKDYWAPTVAGLGFLADSTLKQRAMFRDMWQSMLVRCYSTESTRYSCYGAKGVHVDPRWFNFKHYADDITLLEGYDEGLYLNGLISVDKDKKQQGTSPKIYSKETCCWLSWVDQFALRTGTRALRTFVAIDPTGRELTVTGMGAFAKEKGLSAGNISSCLKGERKHAKGWTFRNAD